MKMLVAEQLRVLAEELGKEGMKVVTLENSYLTLDGLVQVMSQDSPRLYVRNGCKFEEAEGKKFEEFALALAAHDFLPVIARIAENGLPHYVIAICAHNLKIAGRPLREAVSVSVSIEDTLRMISFPYSKTDENVSFILLPSYLPPATESLKEGDDAHEANYYEELKKSGAVFSQDNRLLFLNGVNDKSTSVQRMFAVINYCIDHGGSDIHISPDSNLENPRGAGRKSVDASSDKLINPDDFKIGGRVRYRIDGQLVDRSAGTLAENAPIFTKKNIIGMIAVIKQWAFINIAGHKKNVRARITFDYEAKKLYPKLENYDLRVSIGVTIHGENAILRLQGRNTKQFTLKDTNLPPELQGQFERKMREPRGIILVTGPTGSGKSTTLFAGIGVANKPSVHVVSIEDPVEFQMKGITQFQVDNSVPDLTYAGFLETALRQDPDIILVGEIIDATTAQIAIRAAMTGHLVLSTLHTNTALQAVSRLLDMGVKGYFISDVLLMVMAQRLVRKLCPKCREMYNGHEDLKLLLGKELRSDTKEEQYVFDQDIELWRPVVGKHCSICQGSGYSGRHILAEGFAPNPEAKRLIAKGDFDPQELNLIARKSGFISMAFSAVRMVLGGITSIEEIIRTCTEDDFLRDGPSLIAPALKQHLLRKAELKAKADKAALEIQAILDDPRK